MADSKITDLTALTGANLATGDVFEVSDISDTTMDASGTSKKMTAAELAIGMAAQGIAGGDYFRSGYYSHGLWLSASFTTLALTLNRVYARPFFVPTSRAFDRIGINVSTASAGGSGGVLRMGIYANGGGVPGALLLDAGTVSSESTTGAKEITISQTLTPGVYWLAVDAQVTTCTVSCYPTTITGPFTSMETTPATGGGLLGAIQSSVSGALPNPMVPALSAAAVPAVSLRAA